MNFFEWDVLGSYAGAVLAVAMLTQITKGIPGIRGLPTQLWSYLLALMTLVMAQAFGGTGLSASGAALQLFNAAVVSLAANGGYQAVTRVRRDSSRA